MATAVPYKDKDGRIVSYQIQVFRGRDSAGKKLKPYTESWKVPETYKSEKAIKKALDEAKARAAMVSSTKSMTGHMLGAAGAFECVACALSLSRGVIFPTIHLEEPDPECDLDYVPGTARAVQAEAAISVSLGFGGHNAAIALRRCV